MPSIFETITLGATHCRNRVAMAPLTRNRSSQPGNVPNDLMAQYYAQRAGFGLIVSEATQISPQGQGYLWARPMPIDRLWAFLADRTEAATSSGAAPQAT